MDSMIGTDGRELKVADPLSRVRQALPLERTPPMPRVARGGALQ
jgi:hypothetical protein